MKKITFLIILGGAALTVKSQNISTLAGNGTYGSAGDGGQATAAEVGNPIGVCTDAAGNVYIGDYGNSRIRKVNTLGIITTFAGTGVGGYSGDGGQATAAQINGPGGVVVDAAGNVYFAELLGARVRMVNTNGVISTFAGTGGGGFSGDGGQATAAQISFPTAVAFDTLGNLFIADDGNNRIRKITTAGIISTYAGNGISGYGGDGGPATAAEFQDPTGVCVDRMGNVFVGDQVNYRVRMINTSGVISTVAGTGVSGYSGDGGPATAAQLSHPELISVDALGNVYETDEGNSAIRLISTTGTISTVAGKGIGGFSGDGGPATAAELNGPQGCWVDPSNNNIYIADFSNNRIRMVNGVPLGLTDLQNNKGILVYPNPARDEVFIKLNNVKANTISLYNLTGQQLMKEKVTGERTVSMNISGLCQGIYVIRIEKEDGSSELRKLDIAR